jgi:hypothetical protein
MEQGGASITMNKITGTVPIKATPHGPARPAVVPR